MLAKNLIESAGNASEPNYIESVFSTYLYTGTGSSRSLVNGIDLATKGGMIWSATRSGTDLNGPEIIDTVRGGSKRLLTPGTGAEYTLSDPVSFNTDGITVSSTVNSYINYNGNSKVLWTFREQPKFFDVVTFTGTGSNLTVNHNLGSVPGMIIVKGTSATSNWYVYHRSLGATKYLRLNATTAETTSSSFWNDTEPTSTTFTIGNNANINDPGVSYVAYIFAHDAGGFGLTGTDNVISCGSFTTDGSGNASVTLGYEPQWVLIKQTNGADNWYLNDNMRGMAVSGNQPNLSPNSSAAESSGGYNTYPNATGFTASVGIASATYIYIVIRRGPMKVPTDGTKVYNAVTANAASTPTTITFDTTLNGADWGWGTNLNNANRAYGGTTVFDRLRGSLYLFTNATDAEANSAGQGFSGETSWIRSFGSGDVVGHFFKRAPSFFDEVCYSGTGTSGTAIPHNLGVAPELIISKARSTTNNWLGWASPLGSQTAGLLLNTSDAVLSLWATGSNPTSSNVYVNYNVAGNSGVTYVAYLFATCAGVSKVTNFTGNGSSQTINCGFAAGARFVMIKRTDSTGDWFIFDTSRGIVSGNDPHLSLNTTAAEVTSDDTIDPDSTGFIVNQVAATNCNVNGASYIVLAIA